MRSARATLFVVVLDGFVVGDAVEVRRMEGTGDVRDTSINVVVEAEPLCGPRTAAPGSIAVSATPSAADCRAALLPQ